MVLGQVGEHPHVKGQPRHPVLDQGVGGDLHHYKGTPGIGHGPQQLLQFIALRGGAVGGQLLLPHQVPVGPHQPYWDAEGLLQHLFDKAGGGGLAVGPGDGDEGHLRPRVVKPVGRGQRQGQPGVWGGQPRAGALWRLLAQHRRGPPLHGLVNKPAAIRLGARQGDEQRPRLQRPAVIGQGGYLHVPVKILFRQRHARQQLAQLHSVLPLWGEFHSL